MEKHLHTPITKEMADEITAGDYIYLTGRIYTARDAAHKRMAEDLENGIALPFSPINETIYYLGPTPAKENQVIGSAGPTTSSRMDKYTPLLLDLGVTGMIGKGKRSEAVKNSIQKNRAVYFAAIGGAGALLSKCITKARVIAYEDLGAEAVFELEVKDFPVIAVNDSRGNDFYENSKKK